MTASARRRSALGPDLVRTVAAAFLALALTVVAGTASATTVQRVTSPGGIEAWLVEEHAVPMIAVDFSFDGGSSEDPAGREGLADLLSSLLDEGAGDLPSQAYQTRLEDLSIELSFADRRDRFDGEMKTLSIHRDAAFDLLALALGRPRFDDEAIARMRAQAAAGLRRAAKNPDAIASRTLAAALFPGHPYGRAPEGDEDSLARITRADLVEAHRRLFVRRGLKVAVVGDIDAKTLAPLLDRLFAGLPETGARATIAEVVPVAGARVRVEAAIPQAVVRFAVPGPKRDDPDFMAAYVMNHILGGGSFSSWLYREVREKRGLAYSVTTGLAPLVHAGVFLGAVGTRADAVEETLSVIRTETARMRDEGPSEAELAAAKAFLIGSYPLRFDTSDKIAASLLAIQIDGLGIDWIDRRNAAIEAVSLADVRRVAKRLLSVEPTVVTVGPKGD
jgi:zinc protease